MLTQTQLKQALVQKWSCFRLLLQLNLIFREHHKPDFVRSKVSCSVPSVWGRRAALRRLRLHAPSLILRFHFNQGIFRTNVYPSAYFLLFWPKCACGPYVRKVMSVTVHSHSKTKLFFPRFESFIFFLETSRPGFLFNISIACAYAWSVYLYERKTIAQVSFFCKHFENIRWETRL